jgi:hypothetical protein
MKALTDYRNGSQRQAEGQSLVVMSTSVLNDVPPASARQRTSPKWIAASRFRYGTPITSSVPI